MHVGCYSATLRWDRFGRRWAEPPPPPPGPPPFTSLNIHPPRHSPSVRPSPSHPRETSAVCLKCSRNLFLSPSSSLFLSPFFLSSSHPRVTPLQPSTSPLVVLLLVSGMEKQISHPYLRNFWFIFYLLEEFPTLPRMFIMQSEFLRRPFLEICLTFDTCPSSEHRFLLAINVRDVQYRRNNSWAVIFRIIKSVIFPC